MSEATKDRVPPQSLDAERCVLGSMLRDNTVIDLIHPIVKAESFYFDAHQKIFNAISHLWGKGQPVDLVLLAEHLNAEKHLEDVGRAAYLAHKPCSRLGPTLVETSVPPAFPRATRRGRRQLDGLVRLAWEAPAGERLLPPAWTLEERARHRSNSGVSAVGGSLSRRTEACISCASRLADLCAR